MVSDAHARPLRVVVLVLGDLGRSPRMQYHALALADSIADVDLIGYGGSAPLRAILDHPHIQCHLLTDAAFAGRHSLPRLLFLAVAFLRMLQHGLRLLWLLLWTVPRPHYLVVQTPPPFPTLLVAWIVARLRNARLVIDWHNFGYSMLALTVGPQHFSVRPATLYERALGRTADMHLCVSQMMRQELTQRWSYKNVTVLPDHPAKHFAPTPLPARRELFCRLQEQRVLPVGTCAPDDVHRPALLLSATSWTVDEDFTLLLDALALWDAFLQKRLTPQVEPFAVVLLTGRGPLREGYELHIRQLGLHLIAIHTLWVSAEDYPLLLGSADLGLCLHRSSSGFDLPMKVADMFGSGLPVCAVDYGPCLTEQIHHGENGLLFTTSTQLAEQLEELFQDFPVRAPLLERLRASVLAANHYRWTDAWNEHARPLFRTP
jgi:beta-1,4-mannosyltransferase